MNTALQRKGSFRKALIRDKVLIFLALPGVLYYLIFCYFPMYGVWMAFTNFDMSSSIIGSEFVGLKWFKQFFNSYYCGRLIRNTLSISIKSLLIGFSFPIVFALLLNELRNQHYKKVVQTISYLPHFISTVVTVGILQSLVSAPDGIVNQIIAFFGGKPINFMTNPKYFQGLYVLSGVWSSFGWNSIIYIAAIAGIDQQLYEAATIDGAGHWKQILYVTLPGILPTIMILLIMQLGGIMSVGYEKIILMYNASTYETADVINTYVYRRGLVGGDYSFGAAIGLFNNVINLILLLTVNCISRKVTDVALW